MESFLQYQPLFSEALNAGTIGVCRWNESGTTIDTALPELGTLTSDKESWRAVIVRLIDDNCMAGFECDEKNPYDFMINKGTENAIEENPVPLVRLSQMLGGVPQVEVKFESEIINEPHKPPRKIYVPVENKEDIKKYNKIVEKYRFDGKLPSEILLISVRTKQNIEPDESRLGKVESGKYRELFWKRNHYSSNCRFAVYEFKEQGPVQYEADAFKFWYSVMLLSTNTWDASTLQAYRLYLLNVEIDKKGMEESFQSLTDKLRDAKYSIEKSLKSNSEKADWVNVKLPNYIVEASVPVSVKQSDEITASKNEFPVVSDNVWFDIQKWTEKKRLAEEKLAIAVKKAERALDQTADKTRPRAAFDEADAYTLDKYQTEDMKAETDLIYKQIVDIQGSLPDMKLQGKEMEKASLKVKENMQKRATKQPVAFTFAIIAILCALAAVSAIPGCIDGTAGAFDGLAYVVLGTIVLVLLSGLGILLYQKFELNALIEEYNAYLKQTFSRITENAAEYSRYISKIATYSKGRSFLNLSERLKHKVDMAEYAKRSHLKAIHTMLTDIAKWSRAFRLNVNMDGSRREVDTAVDTTVSPLESRLYALDSDASHPVEINHSGMKIDSPFRFAKRIIIEGEEWCEDE